MLDVERQKAVSEKLVARQKVVTINWLCHRGRRRCIKPWAYGMFYLVYWMRRGTYA